MTDTNQLREAFEARMTDDGKWPAAVEKGRGGAYLLAQTENAWTEWEACAEAMQDRAQAHGEPVAWVVMNGLSKYQVCGAKAPADALCSEMQKRHDLSGSLAAFHVQPLYTHPAPGVRADVVRVPLQVLKDASEALGNFVSDHGWGDADMQAMDNLDAHIARHAANRAAVLTAKDASA